MRFWQKAMIFLATHQGIKAWIQKTAAATLLARRFVGGENENAVVAKGLELKAQNLLVSFFHLGEYVTDKTLVDQTLASLKKTMVHARKADLDLHLSIDPTQAGLIQGTGACQQNLTRLARFLKSLERPGNLDVLMIDMEDASVTQPTLDIFRHLIQAGLPAAITLQACLFQTPDDLKSVIEAGGMVRLVKGAFAEDSHIAHTRKNKIDQTYLSLAKDMLHPDAIVNGFYPVFATHDHRLIQEILKTARKNQISPAQYEFEMLFGVRPDLQQELVQKGCRVRLYLPYGKDFWPYAVRRIGENPKNMTFLIKSLI